MNRPGTRVLAVAGVVLLVLAALFASVDFRIATSNTSTQSSISRFTMGVPQGQVAPMPTSLVVMVEGTDPLANSLRSEMRAQLGKALGVADVRLVDSISADAGQPVAVVGFSGRNTTWTPVYSRAALNVAIAYASDGDMSWRDESPVRMGRIDGAAQIRVRGNIDVADATTGVISEPAYRHHLAEQVSNMVGGALRQQLTN